MTLNIHIREIRTRRGLTLAQLASMVGISVPHMSEVERGKKNLNNHLMIRIAAALNVRPEDLILSDQPPAISDLSAILRKLSEEDLARVDAFAAALLASQEGQ